MKDFFGVDVRVGNRIAVSRGSRGHLYVGVVTKIVEKSYKSYSNGSVKDLISSVVSYTFELNGRFRPSYVKRSDKFIVIA